jgi:hypothetical protein
MTDIRNCYGDAGVGPEIPFMVKWERDSQKRKQRDLARAIERHGVDGVCRVCRGYGYADLDGVYQTCWACAGTLGRTTATTGPFTA